LDTPFVLELLGHLTANALRQLPFPPTFQISPPKIMVFTEGKNTTAGGFGRRSKRHRTPIRGSTFNLAIDFGPKNRDWWEAA